MTDHVRPYDASTSPARLSRAVCAALVGGFVLLVAACSSRGGAEPSTTSGATTARSTAPSSAPTASAGADPARTKIVPAPHGGNIHQHIRSAAVRTAAPVPFTRTARFGDGVSVRIVNHTIIRAKGKGPGQISGPAMALTVRFANRSKRSVDLDHVVVNDQDAHGNPLLAITGSPASPAAGALAPGATRNAVYVFTLPSVRHNPYTISISYTTAAPVVRLVGVAA